MPQETADPPLASSHEAGQISQPPPTPVLPDQPPSKDLHSIASDDDTKTPVFPQSNTDAPVSQVRLELGMEFETLNQFRKAIRKFNIHIGRSIFFARCDSTRSKAICYDEDCPCRNNHCMSADRKWIIDELEERIRVQPNLTCSMRPVPSQELWEYLDTLPILPPRYRKPIGRPSTKRDKRNDAPGDKNDPHHTKRRIGTIVCKYCLRAGHNKRSCKKRKAAMGEGSAASQVPEGVSDEDMLEEMFWEETLEAADAEAATTEDGNDSATLHPAQGMLPQTTTQQQPPTNNATTRKKVKRRSVKRPPPSEKTQQTPAPSANKPSTTPSTHNSETTPHPLQGASAGTSTQFVQFMSTLGVTTGATGQGTAARGRLQSRGHGRKGAFNGSKTGVSSGSNNSIPV
ncbi:hypothetical protein Ahy_B07g087286 [Arachis hypogaea]|uniref:Transposase MuDR plant domain-containing protein n=1 Tax=Arachis hypogaea TaxID=3818 RepID=A0A444YBR8_ARAHY|nr:hypothetical protein Ahy_B07g087286 [Arachis hypogaea]